MGFATETYILERVAAGKVPKASALYLGGFNSGVTTTFETIWGNSSAYVFLAVAMSAPTIVSASANDAAAGTGARTVRITGVNASFALVTEDIALNGTTPVNLVGTYMSINSIIVLTAGSGGVTAGNLTLAAGGTTHGLVLAGRNESTSFIYTVPAGYKLLMEDFTYSAEAASTGGSRAQISYITNLGLSMVYGPWSQPTNDNISLRFNVPLVFPEKTQLQVQALQAATGAGASAFATCVLLNQNAPTSQADNFAIWI